MSLSPRKGWGIQLEAKRVSTRKGSSAKIELPAFTPLARRYSKGRAYDSIVRGVELKRLAEQRAGKQRHRRRLALRISRLAARRRHIPGWSGLR